jgi:hypothetical protein
VEFTLDSEWKDGRKRLFKLLSNELWLIVLAHNAFIYLEYFLTLLSPYGTILDGTGQFFKGTYKLIPCQGINGFAVVGYLIAINSGHCLLIPPFHLVAFILWICRKCFHLNSFLQLFS